MTTVFTDANFHEHLADTNKLTVIDFWATWCPPCLTLGPIIDSLANDYKEKVSIGKVNADENPNISLRYGVVSLPCVLFLRGGEVVDKQVGLTSKSVYEKKIKRLL